MDIDRQQYEQMYKQASKGTKWWVTVPKAFVFGGLICVLGQSLTDMYKAFGLEQKSASLACSVTLIFLSAFLTALGWYEKLAKHAGSDFEAVEYQL